jgi:acyl carrier protein
MSPLESRILSIIEKTAPSTAGKLTPTVEIRALEIDSLEFVEIVFALEDALGIRIELDGEDVMSRFETLEDVIRAVEVELARTGSTT